MYLPQQHKIWLATGENPIYLEPSMANRHGLIAGATGTGKTVTLKVLAESFSDMGVPVFLADIKGDLTGMCSAGCETKHIRRSIDKMGLDKAGYDYTSYPVRFWDVYGQKGHGVRTTISEMGPDLLSRLLGLNDTQSGILSIVFRIADENGLLLIDLKDLRSMVQYVGDNAKEYKLTYGNIAPQSVGAIQRALLKLEDEGGNIFFGEPALDLSDWVDWAEDGRGVMNILECQELFQHPLLYGTFLLWMLSELYEMLPEAGDLDKPKLAFFFDEAHLLFKDAPKALIEGEALVSVLDEDGIPSIVDRAGILPPRSSMNAAEETVVKSVIQDSPLFDRYTDTVDRRSAYEVLRDEAEAAQRAAEEEALRIRQEEERMQYLQSFFPTTSRKSTSRKSSRQTPIEKMINSTANTIGRELGKQIVRGLFGTYRR